MRKKRRKNKFLSGLRNFILILMMAVSIITFVMASCQMLIANPYGSIAQIVSALYILCFCWANEVEIDG
jgi:membrane glycosyltransferase